MTTKKQRRARAAARREEFLKSKQGLEVLQGFTDKIRTPEEWQKISGMVIDDPDGWRGDDAKDWSEAITLEEWARRVTQSTFHYKENEPKA